jgi:hypothetical protein
VPGDKLVLGKTSAPWITCTFCESSLNRAFTNAKRCIIVLWTFAKLLIQCLVVTTLALGLRPRQRELQGCGPKGSPGISQEEARELNQEEARESRQKEARETHHILPGVQESARECEGMNTHTPKATPTLGDGVPVDFRSFRERLQGSNLNGLWRSLYQWKALEA